MRWAALAAAAGLVLTGCGSEAAQPGASASQPAASPSPTPEPKWLDWIDEPRDLVLFGAAGQTALLYDDQKGVVVAKNAAGQTAWEARVRAATPESANLGPVHVIRGENVIMQDYKTGVVSSRRLDTGEVQWQVNPAALGKCHGSTYVLMTDPELHDDSQIVLSQEDRTAEDQLESSCKPGEPFAAAFRVPQESGAAPEMMWKAVRPRPSNEGLEMSVDPTGDYLHTVVKSGRPGQYSLMRVELKSGTSEFAPLPAGSQGGPKFPSESVSTYPIGPDDFIGATAGGTATRIHVSKWNAAGEAHPQAAESTKAVDPDEAACAPLWHKVPGTERDYLCVQWETKLKFGWGDGQALPLKKTRFFSAPKAAAYDNGNYGPPEFFLSYPGVAKDGTLLVLVPDPKNNLKAYNLKTGQVLWSARNPGEEKSAISYARYVPGADTVIFEQGRSAVAVGASDGKIMWTEKAPKGEEAVGIFTVGNAVAAYASGKKGVKMRYRLFAPPTGG